MASTDTWIANTTAKSSVASWDGTEIFRVGQAGASLKTTAAGLRNYIQSALTAAVIATGTITTSTPAISATQTWNAGGVTFTGWKLNVTDTASASGSMLLDVQAGSVSQFSVRKNGVVVAATRYEAGGSAGVPGGVLGDNVSMMSTATLGWTSTSNALNTVDTVLRRDGAGQLALQNGTSAQQFRVYVTSSSANANFERVEVGYNSSLGIYSVLTNQGGTGAAQALYLGTVGNNNVALITNSTTRWIVNGSGKFLAVTDNTYDIGASGANRPRDLFLGGSLTLASNITCSGNIGAGRSTSTCFLAVAAATTSKSAINFAAGAAPSAPADGDLWFDGTDMKLRVGGVTKTFTLV